MADDEPAEDEADPHGVRRLTDTELEEELTIAASTPDHIRIERYEALRHELERRRSL